jgi:hypothetical protein
VTPLSAALAMIVSRLVRMAELDRRSRDHSLS